MRDDEVAGYRVRTKLWRAGQRAGSKFRLWIKAARVRDFGPQRARFAQNCAKSV